MLKELLPGHSIPGPAVIIDELGTIIVEPGCTAEMTEHGDLRILIQTLQTSDVGLELDAVQLSIFSHRFMSIVYSKHLCDSQNKKVNVNFIFPLYLGRANGKVRSESMNQIS